MKTIKFILVIFVLSALISCKKDEIDKLTYGISPETQKDLLCKSLRMLGNNIEGKMPKAGSNLSKIILSIPSKVEISSGVLLLIPYKATNISDLCKLYLQVEGADNYWETKITLDPTSQQPYFSILIPKFVNDGVFNFVFSAEDCNGQISKLSTTETQVSPLTNCSTPLSGQVGITIRLVDFGDKAGKAGISYDAFNIPDRFDVRYNGKWVASSGQLFDEKKVIPNCDATNDGFVSNEGLLYFDYNPKSSRFVELYISGCFSGTKWDLFPICPQ